MEQALILHHRNIWNFFATNYMIFWEKNRQKLKYISLTLTRTKLFLEILKKIKYFIFKEKKFCEGKSSRICWNILFSTGNLQNNYSRLKCWTCNDTTISGEKPPIQGKNERERERGVFTVDSLFFNWILFAKKRNSNQKLKNEVIPEGFQFARCEGKKG